MRRVAVLGSGPVGQVLADGFLKHGDAVTRGTREPEKLSAWVVRGRLQTARGLQP